MDRQHDAVDPAGEREGTLAIVAPTTDGAAIAAMPATTPPETGEPAHHHHYIFARLRRPMPPPTRRRLYIITGALMMSMILCGWNEGSSGPLFPSLQEYYNINYLLMSLIYTTMFVGSLIGGLSNVWITDRIGFGLVTPLAALSCAIAYMMCGTGAPYGVFLAAYVFNGFGMSLQDAQVNNLVSRLPGAHTKMSLVQAAFSIGGTVAPFISTAFAQHVRDAYRYFFVASGIALFTVGIMFFAFEGKAEEQLVGTVEDIPTELQDVEGPPNPVLDNATAQQDEVEKAETGRVATPPTPPVFGETPDAAAAPPQGESTSGAKMKRIFTMPTAWAMLAFSFIYVGVEVSIGGWLTTFLIRERGGSAASGYAVTGFWGGMTVGRIALIPVTRLIGNQVSIYLYSLIAIAFEISIWFGKSLIANGVCYAFVGFFLGPVYPNALMAVAEVFPDELRGGIMGLMGSTGGAGAAAVPFLTGGISDKHGIWTIQPIAVSLIAGYTIAWAFVPRRPITKR